MTSCFVLDVTPKLCPHLNGTGIVFIGRSIHDSSIIPTKYLEQKNIKEPMSVLYEEAKDPRPVSSTVNLVIFLLLFWVYVMHLCPFEEDLSGLE